MRDPQFEGQTKTKLGNSEIKGIVDSMLTEKLSTFFLENPGMTSLVLKKVLAATKARMAAKKARELMRKKMDLNLRFCLVNLLRAPPKTLKRRSCL
jgi:DNA gyrase subunit B (EC 5.99.1.3)